MLATGTQGSSSALARATPPLDPPVMSTRPLLSSVAVCKPRALLRLGGADQEFVTGSYSSTLDRAVRELKPPVTSTWPLPSSVAMCRSRAALRLETTDQAFVA